MDPARAPDLSLCMRQPHKETTMQAPRTGWVVALTAVGSLMAALDTLVVASALSTIQLDFGASVEQLEWTVNAYNLSFAVLLMTGAALGDRFGRRRLYGAGLALFTAASAACALAPEVGWLIAARALQGAGAALLIPLGFALLSAAFPPERRGAAIGMFSAITGVSVALGPLVGGAVVEGISWEWIFWLNVPIGLAALPFVHTRMQEGFGSDRSIDVPGLVLITGAAFGIVWALVRGNAAGWGSAEVAGSAVAGAVLLAGFLRRQLRAPEPMLPARLFRARGFAAGNAATFFIFASLFTGVFFFGQLLQAGLGHDPLDAGLRLMPWTATFITVAPLAGALADRIGSRPPLARGALPDAPRPGRRSRCGPSSSRRHDATDAAAPAHPPGAAHGRRAARVCLLRRAAAVARGAGRVLPDGRRRRARGRRDRRLRRRRAGLAALRRGAGRGGGHRARERARREGAASAARPAQRHRLARGRRARAVGGGPMTERQLLDAARAGDEDAYERLVAAHRHELHAHCYRMLGSSEDAEDALQEALLRAWRGLPRFEGRSPVRAWLYRIAPNALP